MEFKLPADYYYDPTEHLWARIEDDGAQVRVGLDMFGQKAAGTVAYLKIKPVGKPAQKGRAFGTLEAGKYIGPLKAPVNGSIEEVNQKALDTPGLVNTDPYGDGWFVVIKPSNLEQDLGDLVHGADNVKEWLENEYKDYMEKGLFPED